MAYIRRADSGEENREYSELTAVEGAIAVRHPSACSLFQLQIRGPQAAFEQACTKRFK